MSDDRQQVKGMTKGQFGDAIQSLPTDEATHAKITVGASSQAADMTGAQLVRIATNTDAYIKFGVSGVTATVSDLFFPAGVEVLVMPITTTHVAIIQESAIGVATITKVGE